jgi:uncharacterized membrane protein
MTQALTGGLRRVVSAPAVLASLAALSLLRPLYPNSASRGILVEYAIVTAFLFGGVLDRYARARPTRATGFFGACGRHVGAMLRLAAIEIVLYLAADNVPVLPVALGIAIAVNIVGVYARVRVVVEDRRSALGAMLASWRFVARNPGAAIVYTIWMAPMAILSLYVRGAGPILVLPLLASATVFFQSRLAHAGYTAAPPVEWPESPAAEAIANRG